MLTNYLIVAAILFSVGTVGFLTRRNMIVMFLSAEMMLQGVSLNLVSFGRDCANRASLQSLTNLSWNVNRVNRRNPSGRN